MHRQLIVTLLLLLAAPGIAPAAPAIATAPPAASPPDDGNWRTPAKDHANTRYSELVQVTRENVKDLRLAYHFSTETTKGQESPVLAVDGTLFFTTSYPY